MDHRPWAIPLVIVAAASILWFLDFDGDGLDHAQELGQGTHWIDADTDGDGFTDGQEVAAGLSPTLADADGDGLWDSTEWRLGLDAWVADGDRDGVADGDEGHPGCTIYADCDRDGLPDGAETGGYDALDPDSFDVGLADGVVKIFEDAGQPPGRDADRDGIPDAWEDQDGLIQWNGFDPKAGQRDLLVEFLRVEGPSSGRFALDMSPSYDAVASLFLSGGITMHWIETIVATSEEHRPGFLDTDDLGYYRSVLASGEHTDNPFVTSIVLNPQQTQEDLAGDILGAAFLRSMIATVDYGAHVQVVFGEGTGEGLVFTGDELRLRPVLESHILDARIEQVRILQRAGQVEGLGETADGRVYFTIDGLTWSWHPEWFATPVRVVDAEDNWYQFTTLRAELDQSSLAATIAHELGHTLGLCHAHDPACFGEFSAGDILRRDSSTMSYNAPPGTLNFLGSEWNQVGDYLTCPPQEPIGLLAQGLDPFSAKYESSFTQNVALRACGDAEPVARTLERDGAPATGRGPGVGPLVAYVSGSLALLVVASLRWD